MPRKCLLTHVVALALVVGLLTLTAPVAFAAAPVQDQQETPAVDTQSPMSQAVTWFVGVWEKIIVWFPNPTDPAGTTESSGGEDPEIGPQIDPNS